MTLSPKQFFEFASYSGLFDYISLINYPEIESAFQHEPVQDDFHIENHILYSAHGWINEMRRRKEIATVSSQFKPSVKQSIATDIKSLVRKLILEGKPEEAMELMKHAK